MANVSTFNVLGQSIQVKDKLARTAMLANKKIITIGDSYGAVDGSWTSKIKTYMNLDDDSYFTASEAGAGFINNGLNGHNFLGLLLTLNVPNPELITDIVVGGGANDAAYDLDPMETAISGFCTYCREHYPNAKVSLAHFGKDYVFSYNGILKSLTAYTKLAGKCGATYITNSEHILCLQSDWKSDDTLHPSAQGQEKIASYISSGIIGGSVDVRSGHVSNVFTKNDNVVTAAALASYQSQDNGTVYWEVEGVGKIELAFSDITLPGDATTMVKIGTLSNDLVSGLGGGEGEYITNGFYNPKVVTPGLVENADGWHECDVIFAIKHHDVYLGIYHTNPSTHTFETLTGINHMFAVGFSTTINTSNT